MAYDVADQHAAAIIWTLPRTSYQTVTAMRRAGWTIKDNLVHLFGTGWAKTGNALAPGQEGWILATKGKPDINIDVCRVPRGGAPEDRMPGGKQRKQRNMNAADDDHELIDPPLPDVRGSIPKNALLSHCEECVKVGVKRVKSASGEGDADPNRTNTTAHNMFVKNRITSFGTDGTESVPAWHCLAGCVCGARSKWDPERSLPRCHCGETWQWICAVAEMNAQSGNLETSGTAKLGKLIHHKPTGNETAYGARTESLGHGYSESGGSSRFFNTFSYLSKCSSSERHAGCENLFWKENKKNPFGFDQVTKEEWEILPADQRARGNVHPTVKSYRLMHWLHSLTGAPKVVDLSAGSGTGMLTTAIDDIEWIGAEVCPEAVTIAQVRHAFWSSLSPEAIEIMRNDSATKAIQKQNKLARLENK
jgi:hypothetical protein